MWFPQIRLLLYNFWNPNLGKSVYEISQVVSLCYQNPFSFISCYIPWLNAFYSLLIIVNCCYPNCFEKMKIQIMIMRVMRKNLMITTIVAFIAVMNHAYHLNNQMKYLIEKQSFLYSKSCLASVVNIGINNYERNNLIVWVWLYLFW